VSFCALSPASAWLKVGTAQYTAVKNLFKTLEIQVDAVTHMGRKQMADDTGNAGVENSRIEQHGLWSLNSQFQRRYQRATPFAVLLSIAGFDPERADLYFVPRASIGAYFASELSSV
jgi:hypothetical protein